MKPRTIAMSYSRIKMFEECPRQFYYKHIMRMQEPPSPILQRGSDIHKALELYLTGRPADTSIVPLWAKVLGLIDDLRGSMKGAHEAERKIALTTGWRPTPKYFGPDAWWRSQLDWTLWTEDRRFALSLDWKTGKRWMDATQLWMNAMALFAVEPRLEQVDAAFVWLDQGVTVDVETFHRPDAAQAQERVEQVSDAVEACQEAKEWPAVPSAKCRWCVGAAAGCEKARV